MALDQKLKSFKLQHPEMPFYTVLISDHGMAGGVPLKNVITEVEQTINNADYLIRDKIKTKKDIALISFGLLTSFVIYSKEEVKESIAQLTSTVNGVDLCVTAEQNSWKVVSRNGYAFIHRKKQSQQTYWRYDSRTADPLNYNKLLAKLSLSASTKNQRKGWFSDQQWFDISKKHHFPDALYRIANGFKLVTNPASVVCSVAPGYMFGSLFTEYVAIPTVGSLQWTHGALHSDASLGFLMTDIPDWPAPEVVRYNQALQFLSDKIHIKQ